MQFAGFDNIFDAATIGPAVSTLVKLGIAVLLGGLIGIERELTRRPAGIRTHMLVCLGCCLFSEVRRAFDSPSPDRVAAQILTGVGFLGAGTILRTGLEIKGLTTAASIWTVAAIGMSVSLGGSFLWIAVATTLLTLATLRLVAALEDRIVAHTHEHQLLVTVESRSSVPAVIGALESIGAGIERLELERLEAGTLLKLVLKSKKGATEAVSALQEVISVTWADAL